MFFLISYYQTKLLYKRQDTGGGGQIGSIPRSTVRYIPSSTPPPSTLSSTQTSCISLPLSSHSSDTRPSSLVLAQMNTSELVECPQHLSNISEGPLVAGVGENINTGRVALMTGTSNDTMDSSYTKHGGFCAPHLLSNPLPEPIPQNAQYLSTIYDSHLISEIPVLPPEQYMDPQLTPEEYQNTSVVQSGQETDRHESSV